MFRFIEDVDPDDALHELLEQEPCNHRNDSVNNRRQKCSFEYVAFLFFYSQNRTDRNDIVDANHIAHGGTGGLQAEDYRNIKRQILRDRALDAAES